MLICLKFCGVTCYIFCPLQQQNYTNWEMDSKSSKLLFSCQYLQWQMDKAAGQEERREVRSHCRRWKDGRGDEKRARWRRERCLVSQASCTKMPQWGKKTKQAYGRWRLLIALAFRVDCSCRDCLWAARQILCEKCNRKQHCDWLLVPAQVPYWTIYN